jgi:dimethylargininase
VIAILDSVDVARFGSREILAAAEPSGAHALIVEPDTVILAASAPATAAVLRRRGLTVEQVDISEFEAMEGGVTCLSILVG